MAALTLTMKQSGTAAVDNKKMRNAKNECVRIMKEHGITLVTCTLA